MSKAKCFLLAATATAAAMAFILSCSDELKPIERETWEDYQRTLSSSGGAANPSSSSEGTNLSSSGEAEPPYSSSGGGEQKAAVSGVSQKGPFLNNSSVTLYELDSDLAQRSGRVFQAMTDEKGGFEIKGIELASPYALLKADGFYRNEVTGGNSSAPITLYAIADMGGKSSANVNILTHLEYYRVQELAKGRSLAEAKKQALGEILAVFGIDGSGFKGSEEMSVFGTGDADAALLAISILLQGNLSEGSFLALLADFSQKLKENGAWDSKAKKAEMAEWASSTDLDAIRGNIANWGLSESVPDFEKYIRSYAEANSPKGGCEPSENYFCHSNRLYEKCGGQDYNPDEQFCLRNQKYSKCYGVEYAPPEEMCKDGVVGKECNGAWYDPSKKYCLDGEFHSCNEKPFNPVTQFCHSYAIYDKCGGTVTFAPETEKCCGSVKYTLATHSCHNGQTYSCGNLPYNPSTQFCFGSMVHDKCGGTIIFAPGTEDCCGNSKYTLATHSCHNGQTYSCGNLPYNPSTHFCHNGQTYSCGNKPYNPSIQFCYNNSKVGEYCGTRTVEYDPDLYQCKPQINPNGIYLKSKPQDADSKEYEAVLIGTQTWMAENLDYVVDSSECFDNNPANCNVYGSLYNWSTAMGLSSSCNSSSCSDQILSPHNGICPSEWHIPSAAEWTTLKSYVENNSGCSSCDAAKLRAASGCSPSSSSSSYLCEDAYGFSALPGGYKHYSNGYVYLTINSAWWTADERSSSQAYGRGMYINNGSSYWDGSDNKSALYSIRCVKD